MWSHGEGRPLLLIHGSLASHRFWHRLVAALGSEVCAVAPDLAGYGKSTALPDNASALDSDRALIVELLERIGAPVDVVAHSYGGAAALMAVLQCPRHVRSLTLVEPTLFPLLRAGGDWQNYRRATALTEGVAAAMRAGDRERALDGFLSHWLPPLSRWLLPAAARKSLLRHTPRLLREVETIDQWCPDFDALRSLPVPVLLMAGSRMRAPMRGIVELLGEQCPHWRQAHISGAGHFAPVSHPRAVAACLADWLGQRHRAITVAVPPSRIASRC